MTHNNIGISQIGMRGFGILIPTSENLDPFPAAGIRSESGLVTPLPYLQANLEI